MLAEDTTALLTLPPWDNSAMDGFAVRSADVGTATPERPVTLRVIGEVAAGHEPAASVEAGTAVRMLTGAMVPPGADAVVKVEDTDAAQGMADLPESVDIRAAVAPGHNIRACRGRYAARATRCFPPARGSDPPPSRCSRPPATPGSTSIDDPAWPSWLPVTS